MVGKLRRVTNVKLSTTPTKLLLVTWELEFRKRQESNDLESKELDQGVAADAKASVPKAGGLMFKIAVG